MACHRDKEGLKLRDGPQLLRDMLSEGNRNNIWRTRSGGITVKREASVSAQNKLMELLNAAGTRPKHAYMHTESV